MLEGYVYAIGLVLLLILTATHWLDGFLEERDQKKSRRVKLIFFFLSLLLTQGFYLPLLNGYYLNLSHLLFIFPLCLYHFWRLPASQMGQTAAVILFLAVFYVASQQMFLLDPILMILSPLILYPSLFALLTFLVTTDLSRQWLTISFGMMAGEMIYKALILQKSKVVWVGDASFRDQFFLALIAVTLLTVVWESLGKFVRRIHLKTSWRVRFLPGVTKRRA